MDLFVNHFTLTEEIIADQPSMDYLLQSITKMKGVYCDVSGFGIVNASTPHVM